MIACQIHSGNFIDSLSIKGGYLDGWNKDYIIKNDVKMLRALSFYDQEKQIFIFKPIISTLKSKTALAEYQIEDRAISFLVVFNSKKITIKQTVTTRETKKVIKTRFKTIDELDCFLSHHKPVYKYCKQAGFFGEPKIEQSEKEPESN